MVKLSDEELNVLVAADSFAFFTAGAPQLYKAEGEERLRDKIRFMVEKMPDFARKILASHRLENPLFERIKNEVLEDGGVNLTRPGLARLALYEIEYNRA